MNLDLGSIVNFLLVYFLFCFIQYLVGLMENVFELISAYLACKLVDYQEKLDTQSKEKESSTCIGFQVSNPTEEEDEENEE